ncbi:hypothetical protein [Buttiauxella sp. 3AFRM03]|uniref:hypothetical protein n=1 Tax=Buttiauxella sp. 3AFRM03 TaxID=2479367 RepID=UPI0013903712|nr:hypothetical protein [Buttiauxella sp. 3AFRM03]
MSKSIGYYMENGGTGQAAGKMFKLHGMEIGVFMGMTTINEVNVFAFVHPVNGRMDIPLNSPLSIPIEIGGNKVIGPILTPVLYDVIQVE